ncbi:MAG: hypothetical protein KAS32_22405 [Candidatus Peribacteraceae bacterium]|nr:hypothetical protein [Candidatus Peribacteraceae bacterium]
MAIDVDVSQFGELNTIPLKAALDRGFHKSMRQLAKDSKENHQYKNRSGKLSASTRYVKTGLASGEIRNDQEYASFIYGGTNDHFISPKSADGVLAFNVNGAMFFSKGHWVSGIKAEPWIENNYNANEARYDNIILKEIIETELT